MTAADRAPHAGVVAVGCLRSVATTTTALALTAAWPNRDRVVLAECDPAGGTLAAALGLPGELGLSSLAATARRTTAAASSDLLDAHVRLLPSGAAVLVGPASAQQIRSALALLPDPLRVLGSSGRDVIVDVGRLDAGTAPPAVVTGADLLVLVCRPQLPDLQAVAGWLEARHGRPETVVVLTGSGPYPAGEVADALTVDVLVGLPWEPRTTNPAATLAATAAQSGSRRRGPASPLRQHAERLARDVHVRLTDRANPPHGSAPAVITSLDSAGPAAPRDAPDLRASAAGSPRPSAVSTLAAPARLSAATTATARAGRSPVPTTDTSAPPPTAPDAAVVGQLRSEVLAQLSAAATPTSSPASHPSHRRMSRPGGGR